MSGSGTNGQQRGAIAAEARPSHREKEAPVWSTYRVAHRRRLVVHGNAQHLAAEAGQRLARGARDEEVVVGQAQANGVVAAQRVEHADVQRGAVAVLSACRERKGGGV